MFLILIFILGFGMEISSKAVMRVPVILLASQSQQNPGSTATPNSSTEPSATQNSVPPGAGSQESGVSTPAKEPVKKSSSSPAATHRVAAHKKKRHKRNPSGKVVVKNGSTPDPAVQFSTTASPAQASHERQTTAGLMTSTGANLQKLSEHPLTNAQKDMMTQIRTYMQQAKNAEDAGDLQSAYNLALKANLLSNELVRK